MVAGQQHFGHARATELLRARVLRRLEQPRCERLPLRRARAAEHARQQPRHRVGDDQGGQLAPREDVVADRQPLVGDDLTHALVHALVTAGDEDQVRLLRQLAGDRLRERAAARVHEDHPRALAAQRLHRRRDRLGLEHHPAAPAELIVVGDAMLARCVVSEIDHADVNESARPGAAEHRRTERRLDHAGEQRHDIDPHRRRLTGPVTRRADGSRPAEP